MSFSTLVTLSVVEIVALVGVLAFFLLVLTKLLRHVASNLHQVSGGVAAIQGHLDILGAVPSTRTLTRSPAPCRSSPVRPTPKRSGARKEESWLCGGSAT
jgi:hypothetical protein